MRNALTTAAEVAGAGCVAFGFGMFSPAIGIIVAGLAMIGGAFALSDGEL